MLRYQLLRSTPSRRCVNLFLGLVAFALLPIATSALAQDVPEPIYPELASSRKPMMDIEKGWQAPPRIARTRCWWWWLNGNVTPEAIARDLAAMKAQGYGGANVIDAGGADQRGNRQVPHGPDFATPEWRKQFVYALKEADRQGLELGFNILSGWNMGGPGVTPDEAAKKLTWSQTTVDGGGPVEITLEQPRGRDGYYRDVAVVAVPLPEPTSSVAFTAEASSGQGEHSVSEAVDGDRATFWVSGGGNAGQGPTEEKPQWIELRFDRPVEADRLVIVPRPGYGPRQGTVEAIADGKPRPIARFEMKPDAPATVRFSAVTSDRFRLVMTAAYDPRFPDRPRNVQIAELSLLDGDRQLTAPQAGGILHFEEKAYYKYPGAFTATEAWHLLDSAPDSPADAACKVEDVVDLGGKMDAEGRLAWDAPAGRWKVLRFGYTITGAEVSTHSEGWAGLAIDYLDRGAFDSYWRRVMEPILADARPYLGRSLRFLHTDSWELGPVNWTPEMPQQFRRLRGYDITPYLPVMANCIVGDRETSTRFLNDLRRTLADLIAENNYVVFSEHAHAVGLGIHPESGGPHAAPIDALGNLGISDIPMGEFWARAKTHRVEDYQRFFVKQNSSAAHVYGRRVSLAEAFTTIGPQWERDPRMLRPTFDRAACEGHNLTMWHTFDCSPAEMGIPGQDYFAGTHLNPQVTWWNQSHAFIGYLNRCQFLLQQGLPVSDVVHYYGENIPSFVRLKRDDPAGVLPGYDYDVIDTRALVTRATVKNGRIVLPDGTSYRLLSLTPHNAVSLPTLEHVARLVEDGATLVGPRPTRQYSLSGYPQTDTQFAALCDKLWGKPGSDADEHGVGKGRVIAGRTAREVLEADGVGPDFTWTGGDDQTFLDYIHRTTDAAEIYFVVNRNDRPESVEVSFRTSGRQPELWDPVTGVRRDATAFRQAEGRTLLPLDLDGEESLFVVFRRPIDKTAAGNGERNMPAYKAVRTISGPWTVKFDTRWGGPAEVVFDRLTDWTERPEEGIRYYSGAAVYENTFGLPDDVKASGPLVLDLGEVKNLAEVTVNGQELGVVWASPARVDITSAAKAGRNAISIKVVNLWPNRLIGDQHLPPEKRLTQTNITKFTADSPLLPSGLLGPVRVLRAE